MSSFRKKALFFSLVLALGVTLWKKAEREPQTHGVDHNHWIHFKKDEGKIISRKPTLDEIDEMRANIINKSKENKREIASLEKKNEQDKKRVPLHFWNPADSQEKKELNDLEFINKHNPEWKNKLAQELMRFQKDDVEVFLLPEKSIVKIVEDDKAMMVEEVLVMYKTKNGPYSYNALVDSENGKILETWGKTHFDRFKARTPSSEDFNGTLTPQGTL